jgi:dipeptidyl aminopeptidase/acylaminoacyl peptidase
MGFVGGRTGASIVVFLILSGGIAACSRDTDSSAGAPTASAPASAPATIDPPASASAPTKASVPRSTRTLVTPAAGQAPDTTFAVKERAVTFHRGKARPLKTTIWYPVGAGPFPLVLFSHGLTSEPSAYASILRPWARAGFVVAAPAYPHTAYGVEDLDALDIVNQPADASYVISQVLGLATTDGDPFKGLIDSSRIAAAGHSAGGITTIGMFSGNRDDRLKSGIVLSGERVLNTPFSGPAAPLLFVHGKLDKTVPYTNGLKAFTAVPWSRAMMAVTKGGHVAITKDFEPVIATTTDFLRWSLYGDAAAKDRLKADATSTGSATWTDQL